MIIYYFFLLVIIALICGRFVLAITKNVRYTNYVIYNIIFPLQYLITGCTFTPLNNQTFKNQKILLMANHPSYFDFFPIFWWAIKNGREKDLIFIAKEDIIKIPILGDIVKKILFVAIKVI